MLAALYSQSCEAHNSTMHSISEPVLHCQKDAFSLPEDLHYLNCAYMSPISKAVEAAGLRGLQRKAVPTHIPPEAFFTDSQILRQRFAALVNAPAARIAIIPAASYGIATVAKNLELQAGQNIVVSQAQFPSNVYAWRHFEQQGVIIRTVAAAQAKHYPGRGRDWNQALLEAIDEATAVVALPHVHWADGTLFDLEAIGAKARQVGAALIIDGTQSVGALPFDVAAVQPDALIVAGYKWLMGPYGLGLAYYGPRFDQGSPLEDSWITRRGSEDFSRLVEYQDAYAEGAARFDMGERSNPILIPMLIQALDDIAERGVAAIQHYCAQLLQGVADEIGALGYQLEDAQYRSSHLFGIRLGEAVDMAKLQAALLRHNIATSLRGDALRVSPNVYNDAEDMAALLQALREARG